MNQLYWPRTVATAALMLGASGPGPATAEDSGGIAFDVVYTGEPISNLSGGIQTGATYLDNLDLVLTADPGSIFGIPGLSGQLYGLYNNSREFSAKFVGDAQIVSNIESPGDWRLYEAWLDWSAGESGVFSVRTGLYDLNSEFDVTETASLFLNGAQGMGTDLGQTGENGPSVFPVTSLALRLRLAGENGAYGQVAVLDGVPGDPDDPTSNEIDLSSQDGALLVLEGGWSGGVWRKLALGAWQYTADFDYLYATTPGGEAANGNGNNGWYAIADRTVWSGDGAVASAFVRVGQADERYNTFETYIGAGASLAGFCAEHPDEAIGLAMAMARTGSEYQRAQQLAGLVADDHETKVELTYRAPITDWLTLQPDIQYIINPGANRDLNNALAVLLRFELAWSWQLAGG